MARAVDWSPEGVCALVSANGSGKTTLLDIRALLGLDWAQVFHLQPPGITFAYSLFDDLADALGVPNPFPGARHSLTTRRLRGRCAT